MAHDGGYGEKGVKKFSATGAPDQAVDLLEVGTYAADVGNRKAGTAARRATLTRDTAAADQTWLGLEFYETDTGRTYRDVGTGSSASWTEVTEPNTNTTFAKRGTVPSPAPRLQIRAFTGSFLTGGAGVVEVAYPGGGFPNAVMHVSGAIANSDSVTAQRGWDVNAMDFQALDQARLIVTTASGGTPATGTNVKIDIFAIGY